MAYKKYEDEEKNLDKSVKAFDDAMSYIGEVYSPEDISNTNWSRSHLFYSLFTSIAHGRSGIKNLPNDKRPRLKDADVGRVRTILDEISVRYDQYTTTKSSQEIPQEYRDFIDWSRRRTTDTGSRVGRAKFICEKLLEA